MPHGSAALFAVQIASPQNAIIAKCNVGFLQKYLNSLFLKDLIAVRLLACGLLRLFSQNTGGQPMNSALLVANAVALAVLMGFHFFPENDATTIAQRIPHYLQLQKTPQLAVTNDQRSVVGQEVSQEIIQLRTQSFERLVF
jgi:hypothetical protein